MSKILEECRIIPGAPNLDAYESDDLREFADACFDDREVSKILFPDRQESLEDRINNRVNVIMLSFYARLKATAIDCRKAGKIEKARKAEDHCDIVYNKFIDQFARW